MYVSLVNDAEKTLEISDEIDHILFTYLTPPTPNDNVLKNPVSAAE